MPEMMKTDLTQVGITRLSAVGFKSINQKQLIEIRPITILAGANSSGKSSMMQPLLLLKQTLEATYDPGALLLDGPNLRFTSTDQLLSRVKGTNEFGVGIGVDQDILIEILFARQVGRGFEIKKMVYRDSTVDFALRPDLSHDEILSLLPPEAFALPKSLRADARLKWTIARRRCFLEMQGTLYSGTSRHATLITMPMGELNRIQSRIAEVIHLTGLRGNPERVLPMSAVGRTFPGTFEKYTASVIAQWQDKKATELEGLGNDLETLGLTWKASADRVSDTQVELRVGRLPKAARGGARDLVNIADVGFGVSQTLPVLVALRGAKPNQLVYIEQPEIHLHPRAQSAMAGILVNAALRGVRVVAETHSSVLLLGIQTEVAEGRIDPRLVKLHWFKRSASGSTEVVSTDVDEEGAFGNWPEDFSDVALKSENRYLDLMQSRFSQGDESKRRG